MDKITKQLITPLISGQSIDQKRQEIKNYFINTWQTYEALFSHINNDEGFYYRAEPLRHPLVFYFGHTATFFINKLILGKFINKRVDRKIESICAVGVDEMSWDDLDSTHYNWPSIHALREYRQTVYRLILSLIDDMDIALPIQQDSLAWIILMGCEHERIHLETSSVIMRMLPLTFLQTDTAWPTCTDYTPAPTNELMEVKGKEIILGKLAQDMTYGWDNEYGEKRYQIENFKAAKFLVSNAEYLKFVEAGGYQNRDYWCDEGQQWLRYTKATMPCFWIKKGEDYYQRNLFNEVPLPLAWPVETNCLEAKAFCCWQSEVLDTTITLPVEAQWYCLRETLEGDITEWPSINANINLADYASSCPVNRHAHGQFFDVVGNVWQWTNSAIDGFSGFEVHPLYDDFSTPTFDGKHNLIKGGSWISTGNETLKSSRYAFRRHFFQHAGFRYIESDQVFEENSEIKPYETDTDICQQLQVNYLKTQDNSANYPALVVDAVINTCSQYDIAKSKILDLGCNVGRSSFELAQHFEHVDGVDFSARYIQHGVKLQQAGKTRFVQKREGDIVDFHDITLTQYGLDKPTGQLHFSQGDACNLKPIYNKYDVVLAQQVLEKCYDPRLFLRSIHTRINQSGLLVILSDYCFDETVADKNKWLGGIKVNGENLTGFEGLSEILSVNFSLLAQQNITRNQAINARSITVSNMHMTVWKKH